MNDIIWNTLVYNGKTYEKFAVSSNGQIKNVITGTVYKQHLNNEGYFQVCVSLSGRKDKKVFKIHKAVAGTFIPNPQNKPQVNHIDGNKQNNYVENLEWVTGSENMRHAFDTGLSNPKRGTDSSQAKLSSEDVIYIRENYIARDSTYGARALGRKFNINKDTILRIIHGTSYVNV